MAGHLIRAVCLVADFDLLSRRTGGTIHLNYFLAILNGDGVQVPAPAQ